VPRTPPQEAVPEPSMLILLGTGFAALAATVFLDLGTRASKRFINGTELEAKPVPSA